MNMRKLNFVLFLFMYIGYSNVQNDYLLTWESIDSRLILAWFEDAKFSIFIHWGLYSVPIWVPTDVDIMIYAKYAEWYWWRINEESHGGKLFREYYNKTYGEAFKYQNFASYFNASHFEPEEWSELLKMAGARYLVLNSKHHEGFALWPSAQSWKWKSVDVRPHRDLCGDLSKAVKDAGLHMRFYYSLQEWYILHYKDNLKKYVDDHMIPQMKDLVTRYEPDVLWTDGEWEHPSKAWESTEFLSWLYNDSPVKESVVVNDRWGKETRSVHGGFFTTEYDLVHDQKGVGEISRPWEECRGIGTSFGYNQVEDLDNYMTSDTLVDLLIEKVAAGGNLLLDIGPTSDGRIPIIQQQRLLDMGHWLEVNGEAIYGTSKWEGSKNKDHENTFFTKKGNDLYVLCTEFPKEKIVINGIGKPQEVRLLGFNGKVQSKNSKNAVSI